MRELHLFAGIGGGILGGILLGHTCVCAVEIEDYRRKVLLQRQRDRILPRFPIWDDVRTFDGKPWQGKVDVVCGGFPCQDISQAGRGIGGINGEKSGLWREMFRIICEVRPSYAFVENSPMLTSRGIGVILGNLAQMGYDAKWGVLGAVDAGADHKRERIWIVANNNKKLRFEDKNARFVTRKNERDARKKWNSTRSLLEQLVSIFPREEDQPQIRREIYDVPHWVDRIESIGDSQVPAVVKLAWETLAT